MTNRLTTPNIEVTIGGQTRLYHAFITTAPAALDAPGTLTLYAGPFCDVVGLANDPPIGNGRPDLESRLILIDSTELAWQRARCRSREHLLSSADPLLVGLTALQQWLWQRLQLPLVEPACSPLDRDLRRTDSKDRRVC